MHTLILDSAAVRLIIHNVGLNTLMDELINRLRAEVADFDAKRYSIPARDGFDYEQPYAGLLEWMPLRNEQQITIKTVGYHPSNPRIHGCATILSNVCCYDSSSGHLMAIMDGTFLTALRTGAASAVASGVLAKPTSATLGIVGCGAQAVSQIHAISRTFPLESVLAYDVNEDAQSSLQERCGGFLDDPNIVQLATLDELTAAADILCTCTSVETGSGPVLPTTASVQRHLHINAVGSDFPGKTEIPHELLKRAIVCPDFRDQAIREGECQQLEVDEIGPNLSDVVSGSANDCDYSDRLTVFDSTGWAIEDHIAANMLIGYARKLNVGTEIQVETSSNDPRDPYAFAQMAVRSV